MVDAQNVGVLHVMVEIGDRVPVALLPHLLRMEWGKAPVLPLVEQRIRGRPRCHTSHKQITLTPGIISVPMNAKREIQIQAHTLPMRLGRKMLQLLVRQPLHVGMVVLRLAAVVTLTQHTIPQRLRPIPPRLATGLHGGPEARVVQQPLMLLHEPLEGLDAVSPDSVVRFLANFSSTTRLSAISRR